MHDLTLIGALCNQIEELAQRHNARKVIRIILEIGEDFAFAPEHFQETFLFFNAENPLLHETQLEFRKTPAFSGNEIILRDVELEVPEALKDA